MREKKWKEVIGYSGIYEISISGIVRSKNRTIKLANGRTRRIKGKTLSPKKNGKGYVFFTLSKDGKTKTHYLHRLLALSYLFNDGNKGYVNHRDGDPSNNDLSNLEWVTHAENVLHGYATGLNTNQGGNHTFSVGVIDSKLGQEFATIKEWCAARGINYSTGRNILSGCNKSRVIDLSELVLIGKTKDNKNGTK